MPAASIHDPIAPAPGEEQDFRLLQRAFGTSPSAPPRLLGPNGETIQLPRSLFRLLSLIVADLAEGRTITILSGAPMLTTQQAADILNVSRPFLVKLLEEDRIPFVHVGKHRRVRYEDLMAYKAQRDSARRHALADLTRMGEDMGDYD